MVAAVVEAATVRAGEHLTNDGDDVHTDDDDVHTDGDVLICGADVVAEVASLLVKQPP